MPGAEWFPGARLNYAEHVFRGKVDEDVAIVHASELRPLGALDAGASCARRPPRSRPGCGPRASVPGDRVVAYLPNIPETVAAFLACASIGAIWSSAAPEFGARSVVDRFAQIEPKVLLAVDGYRYGGKEFDRRAIAARDRRRDPGVWSGSYVRLRATAPAGKTASWTDRPASCRSRRCRSTHPLWVLYTSGTTGLPKAIVHGQGGILLEQLKVAHLHLDAQAGRPPLLVLDDRLDDVELPRRRAADATPRSCCSTATRATRTSGRCGTSPSETGMTLLRDERRVHRARA